MTEGISVSRYSLTNEIASKNVIHFHALLDNNLLVTDDDMVYEIETNNQNRQNKKLLENNLILINKLCNLRIIKFFNTKSTGFALTSDGNLYCFDLTNGFNKNNIYLQLIDLFKNTNIKQISCGQSYMLILYDNGSLYKLIPKIILNKITINQTFEITLKQVDIMEGETIKTISCGGFHSLALTENDKVLSWGQNKFGQLGRNKNRNTMIPRFIDLEEQNSTFKAISCGKYHSLLLSTDGDIFAFGSNEYSQLGKIKQYENQTRLIKIEMNPKLEFHNIWSNPFANISAGVSSDNKIYYVWGDCNNKDLSFLLKYAFNLESYKQLSSFLIDELFFMNNINIPIIEDYLKKEYTINEKLLGEGTYGEVYKAKVKNGNNVYSAIKRIKFVKENSGLKYLTGEYHLISSLKNEFIVHYKKSWIQKETKLSNEYYLYIDMELCWKNLTEFIVLPEIMQVKNHPIYLYVMSEILKQVVNGVNYLHQNKIIHRDLKPGNILILKRGSNKNIVRICDLGLSCYHLDDEKSLSTKGTLKYIAPEVISSSTRLSGRNIYSNKADIFSLGVIFYKILILNITPDNTIFIVDKLKSINNFIDEMTSIKPKLRPSCQEILNRNKEWLVNIKDLIGNADYEGLKDKMIQMPSIKYFFLDIQETDLCLDNDNINEKPISNKLLRGISSTNNELIIESSYKANYKEQAVIGIGSYGISGNVLDINKNTSNVMKRFAYPEEYREKINYEIDKIKSLNRDFIVEILNFWMEDNYLIYDGKDGLIRRDDYDAQHPLFNKKNIYLLHIQMEFYLTTLKDLLKIFNRRLNDNSQSIVSLFVSIEMFREILDCTEYLHSIPILHKNLRPSNIMITYGHNGRFVKLADFAFDSMLDYKSRSHSSSQIGDHLKYADPEIAREAPYSKESDIYSLGALIPELFNLNVYRKDDLTNPMTKKRLELVDDMKHNMISSRIKDRMDCVIAKEQLNCISFTKEELEEDESFETMRNTECTVDSDFTTFFIQRKYSNYFSRNNNNAISK